jgi:hypothetical protein
MTFTRDSAWWWLLLIAGGATFLGGHYDLITKAFPGVSSAWQARLELIGGVATFIAGYLRMSPLALSQSSELASAPADSTRTLSITGKASIVLLAVGLTTFSACAPKEYHAAVVADSAYAQAVFALQDAEIASHRAQLISDAKHQDYKKIVAKLLRAGDAVTIALQHWQPGTPVPQVVASAWKDASVLLADVKGVLPGSDPFIQKIQDVLTLLQKFGLISSAFAEKQTCVQLSCVLCEVTCG